MRNFLKTVEAPRDLWSGCIASSVIVGLILVVMISTTRGPGVGMMIGVGMIAAPLLFLLIHLLIVVPWYWVLLKHRLLNFVSLYFASTFSTILLCSFVMSGGISVSFEVAIAIALVISVILFVLVALFWGFSYPEDSDEK